MLELINKFSKVVEYKSKIQKPFVFLYINNEEFERQIKKCEVKCYSLSHVQLFMNPWTAAQHTPLSMEFLVKDIGVGNHFLLQGIFLT